MILQVDVNNNNEIEKNEKNKSGFKNKLRSIQIKIIKCFNTIKVRFPTYNVSRNDEDEILIDDVNNNNI